MGNINSYEDLYVWQKSNELVLRTYSLVKKLPEIEKYNLISQMIRAVVSISSNIVEGFARNSVKDSLRFYNIANASLEELKSQYRICYDLQYLNDEDMQKVKMLCDHVGASLCKWIQSQVKNAKLSK